MTEPTTAILRAMNITFTDRELDRRLSWYCEPSQWETGTSADGALILTTETDTDYWQRTHYGFRRDNGHLLYAETFGDMTLETCLHYHPAHDFDQAGLMVRFSSEEWIKTSVERETDGSLQLGAVVTRAGYSDWSTQRFPEGPIDLCLQIRRVGEDYHVRWKLTGAGANADAWRRLRIAHLTPPLESPPSASTGTTDGSKGGTTAPLLAGIYAASPNTGGCTVRFDYLKLQQGRTRGTEEQITA